MSLQAWRTLWGPVGQFLILCTFYGNLLSAQLTTGTILGTVKDQTGAVLPGATITVSDVQTGAVRTVVTGTRGEFRVVSLPAGSYQAQASLSGFQTTIRSGITLSVGREAVLDFTLQVGNVAEQVTVFGEAPLIETTTATVSGLVDPKQIRDIPLNGRSFLELVPLQTGAVFVEDADQGNSVKGFGKKLSMVGGRYNTNLFLLDGAVMNDSSNTSGSVAHTMAGVETVQEFRVVTNAYDAEYGNHTGGVVSAITKSGTNEIHGSVFEFLRNDNLDAPAWADNAFRKGLKPEFRRNQFGVAMGGPIIRDKTFFFGSYEGLREALGQTRSNNVPGREMRAGFVRGRFIGINAAVQPFLEAYPFPNQPDRADGTAQYISSSNERTSQDFETARIDHRFSDSDSIFGRVTIDDSEKFTPLQNGLNTGLSAITPNRFGTIEETHIWSSRLIMRTHASFNRTHVATLDLPLEGYLFPKFSFSDVPDSPGIISVSGLSGWGGNSFNPRIHIQNLFQFKEDFFLSSGRHSIKFGGQAERIQFNQRAPFNEMGVFSFSSLEEFLQNNPSTANFVKPGSDSIRAWRQSLIGLYLHDDIAVRPGLNINLGLRYEFISVPTEANGKMANIRDLSPAHLYTVRPEETDIGEPWFLNPSLKNFEPRIGLAWSPFGSDKTSLRTGFGIFHEQILPYIYNTTGVRVAPFFSVSEMFRENIAIDFPNAFFTQRDALVQNIGSKPQGESLQWKFAQPTVFKWSFDIQRQITSDSTVQIGYTGTRGVHLVRGSQLLNTTPAEIRNGRRFFLVTEPLPNPNWNRLRWQIVDGTSDYHSLRLSFNKQFKAGLQLQSSYTFAKSTDDGSTLIGPDYGSDRGGYRDERVHGLTAFDIRQSFYTNVLYELPGKNWSGLPGKLGGGWSVAGVLRFNSGYPFSLSAGQPRQGSNQMRFVGASTIDLVPGGNQNPIRPQNPNQYFDVKQFKWPVPFFEGDVGRNHIIAPGIANLDITLMKDTQVPVFGENGSMQFRAEFFNLFNRPNFSRPASSLFDTQGRPVSSAGQITSTLTSSRQIQLALKVIF